MIFKKNIYEFATLCVYFEAILFTPLIIMQIDLLCSNNKNKFVLKYRKKYFNFALKFNKKIVKLIINLVIGIGKASKSVLDRIISGIKHLRLEILYYRYGIKKLDFKTFCRGIRDLTPDEFEEFTATLYSSLGYKVKLMPIGPDGGKDVILEDRNGDIYLECKRYLKCTVGREICQKLIGAAIGDNVKRAILFTCGKVHKNAYEYAERINCLHNNVSLEIVDIEKMYNLYTKSKVTDEVLKLVNNT